MEKNSILGLCTTRLSGRRDQRHRDWRPVGLLPRLLSDGQIKFASFKGTWQWGGFSAVFAEIGSSWVPYTNFPGRSDFGFEFAEIFVFEKRVPAITNTGSRQLPASPIRRVGYWIFKEKTLCIDDTKSRRLPAPVIRWIADSPFRWVGESPSAYHRYGESMTPRIVESGSRRLRGLVIRGVAIQWKK